MGKGRGALLLGAVAFGLVVTWVGYRSWIAPVAEPAPARRASPAAERREPTPSAPEAPVAPEAPAPRAEGAVAGAASTGSPGEPLVVGETPEAEDDAVDKPKLHPGLDLFAGMTDEKMDKAFRKWTDAELCANMAKAEALVEGDKLSTPKGKDFARRIYEHQQQEAERRGISCD